MVWILFLALVGVTGAGGWQMYNMQQSLLLTQNSLQQTKDVLNKVTGDVSATGANVSQTDSAFRSEIKVVNDEIRKLWDVSNKRNRAWINDNKAEIDKNDKKLEYAASSAEKAIELAESGKQLTEQTLKNTDKIQAKMSELDQLLKAVTTEQLVSNSDMTANLESLKQEVVSLAKLMEEQKRLESEIDGNVAKQAELNKSFSSYRSQTNRRLQQLENSLRDLAKSGQQGLTIQ